MVMKAKALSHRHTGMKTEPYKLASTRASRAILGGRNRRNTTETNTTRLSYRLSGSRTCVCVCVCVRVVQERGICTVLQWYGTYKLLHRSEEHTSELQSR